MSPGRIKFRDIQLNLKEPETLLPDYKYSRPLGDVPGLASSTPDFPTFGSSYRKPSMIVQSLPFSKWTCLWIPPAFYAPD